MGKNSAGEVASIEIGKILMPIRKGDVYVPEAP